MGSSFNYDQIGNITTDATAGQTFVWTPHGRIDQRYQTTNPANKVENVYDGQGNVVMEKTTNAGVVTKTYFIRDATGNVLAVYKQNGSGGTVNIEKRYIYGSDQIASLSGPNTYSGSSIPVGASM